MAEKNTMSLDEQQVSPVVSSTLLSSEGAKEQLIQDCEEMWKQMEECQNRLTLQEIETLSDSDPKLSLLMKRVKALSAELYQWQKRKPDVLPVNPDVLTALGRHQLQEVDQDLEMVLSTIQAKNEKLKQDLVREQQWLEEQQQLMDCLNQTEEENHNQVVEFSEERAFQEIKTRMLKIKPYKDKILTALGEFLEEHFPLPDDVTTRKKRHSSKEPDVQLISLHEILESLIHKFSNTPHDPYVSITTSFWAPYIELLLRNGIALRHPEDPNRIRLENFTNSNI
ncbi:K isoform X1 [Podarcis lilfordi]|uniref:K isoform X1 n=1 Tax=Podarcis lilfordi TaxID=74358 RepID=A0AA35PJY5_9SAUR|nr:K isoform X1 [Podarcis lilfordi]